MQTIEIDKVTSYRVKTREGPLLMELVDAKGRKLIVSMQGGPLEAMFRESFGGLAGATPKACIVLASPDMVSILLVASADSAQG